MERNHSTILHVSDVHFGAEDPRALEWFATAACAQGPDAPDAIVCTGDLTQRATHRQYARAGQWFASLGVPVMLQPGNHDMPYYNLWERFRRPYARFDRLNAMVGRQIELEHAVIVPLDTNAAAQWRWPWSDGVITQSRLAATIEQLEALRDDPRVKLVACHHPLLPADPEARRNPTIRGEMAVEALAQAGANAVLSGHVHQPFDITRAVGNRSLRMIGAGTLSTRLRGVPPSYNLVRVDASGGIEVERRDIPPENEPEG